jgi:hypothetical protein
MDGIKDIGRHVNVLEVGWKGKAGSVNRTIYRVMNLQIGESACGARLSDSDDARVRAVLRSPIYVSLADSHYSDTIIILIGYSTVCVWF